ncbi:MAG: chromosome segregation protein SMC [Actinomycetaceae bacterium]|nr:chromosome segregation protein SMC [Actinomycetaceae bacterium]
MHLKTLTLRGFKSFASTTTLTLEPGITCVVGPNGSGKSNVVDALAWVMGEQGAKNLRGGQMADVIFAGTLGRAPLGRAQVSLTIDNADGALPIDYSEVTISRTLFRGGGSEYSINNTPCRLLDIQELLSDTGMGRQMHVIVGQGQLDQILAAGPHERRGFIEEAAGVLKHRRRKERALRKLESMEANLVRVRDLTNEIHRQLRPLAKQAETARRAGVIQAEVRDAHARLLADDLQTLKERLDAGKASEAALATRREGLEQALSEAKKRLEEAEELARRGTPKTQRLTRMWQEINSLHANLSTLSSLAGERTRTLSAPLIAPRVDIADLEKRVEDANAEDAELLKQLDDMGARLAQTVKDREQAEAAARTATETVRHLENEQASRREHIARLIGDVNTARQNVESAEQENQRMRQAVTDAHERTEAARAALAELGDIEEEADDSASRAHAEASRLRDDARDLVDSLLVKERDAGARVATWVSRRDTLVQSLTPEDATSDLLAEENPSILGALAHFITVEPGYENAVSALLDPFADAAVISALGDATALSSEAAGQQRMVVIAPAQTAPTPSGLVGAADVVDIREPLGDTIRGMLSGSVIVESLAEAERALAHDGVERVATRLGDVVTRHTVRTAGEVHASIIERHAEAERASAEAEKARGELAEISQQLEAARQRYDELFIETKRLLTAMREADSQRASTLEVRARATSNLRAAEGEESRLAAAAAKVEAGVERAHARLREAETKQLAAQNLPAVADPGAAREQADDAEKHARDARALETQTRLDLRTTEERSARAKDRARSLRQQLARAGEENREFQRREAERQRELANIRELHERIHAPLAVARHAMSEAERQVTEAENERTDASEAAAAARREVDEIRTQLLEVTDASHRDEIARQEIQLRYDHTEATAREELGLDADELLEKYGPHNLVEAEEPYPYVRAEQEKRLRKAKKDLDRLGKINPLALEEHEALSKRHQFLADQLRDLTQSKADLLGIVDEVDTRVEEVFTQAFLDTQEAFTHVFATLFPGGTGKLVLTDPNDMLNTGVEIEARPAGKKITRLSLLSGGERSLAAVALLVAIFKARPSPFYVMDEVEAALDDVNLSRLLKIFTELRQDSQLIIVTHQKRTMRIADALYGVSMRGGVSEVVSSQLSQTSQAQADQHPDRIEAG